MSTQQNLERICANVEANVDGHYDQDFKYHLKTLDLPYSRWKKEGRANRAFAYAFRNILSEYTNTLENIESLTEVPADAERPILSGGDSAGSTGLGAIAGGVISIIPYATSKDSLAAYLVTFALTTMGAMLGAYTYIDGHSKNFKNWEAQEQDKLHHPENYPKKARYTLEDANAKKIEAKAEFNQKKERLIEAYAPLQPSQTA